MLKTANSKTEKSRIQLHRRDRDYVNVGKYLHEHYIRGEISSKYEKVLVLLQKLTYDGDGGK